MAIITGTALAETLVGTAEGDTITGLGGRDELRGAEGADILIGGAAGDILAGGAGADTYRYTAFSDSSAGQPNQDTILDFETGVDRIDLFALAPSQVSVVRQGADSFVFAVGPGGVVMQIGARNAAINGGDIVGSPTAVFLLGDDGANTLIGAGPGENIVGGFGDDVIIGGGSGDALLGGAGRDVFTYRSTSESATGSQDVLLDFETGLDRIDLSGVAVTAVSIVRSGAQSFVFANSVAGGGPNMVIGSERAINAADLILAAGAGGVTMLGDALANTLIGGVGADTLSGGAGDDLLTGGRSADRLSGGAGADVFRFTAGADSTVAAGDLITDFQVSVDKLDLTGARTSVTDRYGYVASGGATFLFVDLGGDGVNDMLISLLGVTTLQASDILF